MFITLSHVLLWTLAFGLWTPKWNQFHLALGPYRFTDDHYGTGYAWNRESPVEGFLHVAGSAYPVSQFSGRGVSQSP